MESSKVLILEADRHPRLARRRALSRDGYQVTGVATVEKAVEAVERQPYELLIVSVDEPEMLNRLLGRLPPEQNVLIISPEDMVSRIVESSGAGIHSFLIHPFRPSKFRDAVAQTLDKARLVKESFRSKIMTTLEHASRLLAPEVETDRFFKLVVEISAANIRADYVSLLIKDEATGELVVKARIGDHKPDWKEIWQPLTKTEKPVLIDETTRNYPRLRKVMTEMGISAMLCVPLVVEGNVIGAVNHIKVSNGARFTSAELVFASISGRWSSRTIENARLLSSVQRQRLHLERLLQEITLAQRNERKRISTEIHDSVVQWMVGAFYRLKACNTLISQSRGVDLEFELAQLEGTLQRSVRELRRIMTNLHPLPLEELGLVAALHQVGAELNEDGIRCHIDVDGMLPRLTLAEESVIYWIIQEALTNIRKHSKATEAHLCLHVGGNTVSVEVSDNGQGFNPNGVINSKVPLQHIGLVGMKERAELLGTCLNLNSNPQQGTSVSFSFSVSSRIAMKTKKRR